MAKAKKPIVKSAAVEKLLASAIEKLTEAQSKSEKAVAARTKDAKKFATAVKRLAKRKATLTKRKKAATKRAEKNSSADNRKALRTVIKDLATATRELAKARKIKAANSAELTPLKAVQKRLNAYTKGIAQANKVLNKPKKKPRRKKN